MDDYFRNLLAVVMLGGAFGFIFAPQIDKMKHVFQTWNAKRDHRKRGGPR